MSSNFSVRDDRDVVSSVDGHCDISKDQLSNGFISFKIFENFRQQQQQQCLMVGDLLAWYQLTSK